MKDFGKFYFRLVYFTVTSYIFGHLVYFVAILVYFSRFGMLYQAKSGKPERIDGGGSMLRKTYGAFPFIKSTK
jgi:hypothetical protein